MLILWILLVEDELGHLTIIHGSLSEISDIPRVQAQWLSETENINNVGIRHILSSSRAPGNHAIEYICFLARIR